ncbi:MAG: beta strand repeat-containing protein, partial [Bacteroidales bacterium]
INIVDGIAGVNVTFANSTTSYTYDDIFDVTLNNGAGTVTFNTTCFSGSNALSVTTDNKIIVNGGSTLSTVDGNLTLSANMQPTQNITNFNGIHIGNAAQPTNTYVQSTGTGNVSITGRGGASASIFNYGIYIDASTSFPTTITSGGGSVTVIGTGGGSGASSNNDGVSISKSTITSGGNGNVSVSGTGGGSTTKNVGLYLYNSTISSGGSGTVTVSGTGTGGNAASQSGAYGVAILGASHITSGGIGNVQVTGQGSTVCWGSNNCGVIIAGQTVTDTSSISSGGGNVTVNGTGGGISNSSYNIGVSVGLNATSNYGIITSGGNGSITVTGTGSNTGGSYAYGVNVNNVSSRIIANGTGSVSITGYGGGSATYANNIGVSLSGPVRGKGITINGYGGTECTGSFNIGIYFGSTVYATGTGTVVVNGTGGGKNTSILNSGIYIVSGSSRLISSESGNVSVTGIGGSTLGTGIAGNNCGILQFASSIISAGGVGTVSVIGTGGGKGDAASLNSGIYTSGIITSGGGNVTLEGHEGAGTASVAINLPSSTVSTLTNGGLLSLKGNSLIVGSTSNITIPATSGNLNLIPATAGVDINLGSGSEVSGGPIAITADELARMSGGHLNFGDANTGTITISDAMSASTGSSVKLTTASTGGVIPSYAGTDLTLAETLSFGSGTPLKIDIAGTTVNTGYQQLNVAGVVDLTGATLSLSGSYTPVDGDVFTIVNASMLNGIFTGLNEGDQITFNGKSLTINYGMDGVTLTAGPALPPPTISSFTPTTAATGTTVTITGTNFTGATAVSFGGTAATSVSVVNATSITAVVAGGTTGSVSVTTPGGTSELAGFTFIAPPAATAPALGTGTSDDPYQIATLANLNWLTQNSAQWNKYFIQTADIDASATSVWNTNQGWTPIGTAVTSFIGFYNGQGHTIDGLFISNTTLQYLGLFGFVRTPSVISKLGVTSVNISGGADYGSLGSLSGFNSGTIFQCHASGSVTGNITSAGGLIGANYGTIDQSYSNASVTGRTDYGIGGLAGQHRNGATITNCYSTGNVIRASGGYGTGYGGLVGITAFSTNTITDSYSTGRVIYTNAANPTDKGFLGDQNADGTYVYVDNFWDTGTSMQTSTAGAASNSATGKTTAEMKTKATFTGWNFVATTGAWQIKEAGSGYKSYPYIQAITYDVLGASPAVNPIPGLEAAVAVTASAGTTSGGYTTLKAAFDAINLGTHQGIITVKINASITETASAVLNASGSGTLPNISDYTAVTIYPTATGLTISGNLAAPLIDLNGADNVIIDGRVNAIGDVNNLIIKNTGISSTSGNSTIRFINDASSNIVKYCNILGSSTATDGAVVFFSTGTMTGNNTNTIDHNNISNSLDANRPVNGIYSLGTSGAENSGDTISNNNIYDFLNRGL